MPDSHCISLPSKRDTEVAQRSLLSRSQRHYAEAIKQRVIIAEAIGAERWNATCWKVGRKEWGKKNQTKAFERNQWRKGLEREWRVIRFGARERGNGIQWKTRCQAMNDAKLNWGKGGSKDPVPTTTSMMTMTMTTTTIYERTHAARRRKRKEMI